MFFFFFNFGTFYPLYRWDCTFYNTKGNGKRKASILDSKVSEMVNFFSPFIFSQGGEPELKGDRKKRFTKSQSAKGCIFNNFLWIFSHSLQVVVLNSECGIINRTTQIPILPFIKMFVEPQNKTNSVWTCKTNWRGGNKISVTLEEKYPRPKLRWLASEIGKNVLSSNVMWNSSVLHKHYFRSRCSIMCAETLTQALSWMLKSKPDRLSIQTKPQ